MKFKSYLTLTLCLLLFAGGKLSAQCGAGYTQAQLNWDYLEQFTTTGNYAGYVTAAQSRDQNFTIGPNRVNFLASPNMTVDGETLNHTGDIANYLGTDAQFTPVANNDSLVITFASEVMNLNFAIYDIENQQRINFRATNAAGTLLGVNIATQPGSILTANNNGANNAYITSTNTNSPNTNTGTATISITGPISRLSLVIPTIGTTSGRYQFYISDINACVTGSFPDITYHAASRPWNGMPAYAIIVADSNFMLLDPSTGFAKPLFTDTSNQSMNSLGYDPISRTVFYTHNRSGPGNTINPNNKTVWKYSVDAETISTVTTDVTVAPLNIPTFDQGVESAGASFYNGSYYFGIEGYNGARNSGRDNVVWKIDFDASMNPIRASQVYASRSDSNVAGNDRLIHDWSDFVVSEGMIYDFDGAAVTLIDTMYYHYNMMTGQRTQFLPTDGIKPAQCATDWTGQIYNMWGSWNGQSTTAKVAPYNKNGTLNLAQQHLIFTMPGPVNPIGNWADAGEAYRPNCDFGDAPASYDPNPWSPAVHEKDSTLRIGATFDREAIKITSAMANGDGGDEDGISFVPILSTIGHGYWVAVQVYNHTGAAATLEAWLDYNNNGVFDASEGLTPISVPSSTSMQTFGLNWIGINPTVPQNTYTFMRVRLVRGTGTMTSANATGYYDNGETEDYPVLADFVVLSNNQLSFDAKNLGYSGALLTWKTSGEENLTGFELQRSTDNTNWKSLSTIAAKGSTPSSSFEYNFTDYSLPTGRVYYRLKMLNPDGRALYSEIRAVTLKVIAGMAITPNPASSRTTLKFNSLDNTTGKLLIIGMNGQVVADRSQQIRKGSNDIDVPVGNSINDGVYLVQLSVEGELYTTRLVIKK